MADLRCPHCGVPVPDTGTATLMGSGPPDEPRVVSRKQRTDCPSCGKALVRNPQPMEPKMAEWRVDPTRTPLLQFGGTAIMRSTDVPPGTPRFFHPTGGAATFPADLGTLSAAGSASTSMILTTPNQPTPIPLGATSAVPTATPTPIKQAWWFKQTEFEATMMGAGGFVGGVLGGGKVLAAGLGGAVGWVYARYNWRRRKKD